VIAERDQLKGERDGLVVERDGLVSEKAGVIAEREQLEQRMAWINREVDETVALIDAQTQPSADLSPVEV